MSSILTVVKRDGREAPYDEQKIADAIFKAAQAVGGEDRQLAAELASVVSMFLEREFPDSVPGIEDIQDVVERVLIETGHARTAKAYILYREKRTRRREALRVRKAVRHDKVSTDISLLVDPGSRDELLGWDRQRIVDALVHEADLDEDAAQEIARAVEQKIFDAGINRISTALIRELVDNELFERGFSAKLERQQAIGMPKYDLDQMIYSKSNENSNIAANNPEAINLTIAETTLKQYALQEVFSREVADAHRTGRVHLHDLGYPTRVYCSSHSLEYIKKYGLSLNNLDTQSAPAKHARTLTGHLNTFLASMQAYYAGALGVGYINILYAPYLEHMTYGEMVQEAQHLIFSGSQSAFSRGGQTLFLDFNIHTGVPRYLRDVPAIGPGGQYTGKTYGEYAETARLFTRAMLDVWRAGDEFGHIFAFPKCDLHVNEDTFADPHEYEILEYACQIASENGVPYFVFDRDEVTLSACCRLRTKIEDTSMLKHPETMRFCGFQNVTINLPQAAFRAGRGNFEGFLEEISIGMDVAVQAHLEKRSFISKLMNDRSRPLWQIGKIAADGKPYVDLDKATYIIGLVGLNEAIQFLTGEELHDSDEAFKLGLKTVAHMNIKAKAEGAKQGLKMTLEESPAESAARRLAKVDMRTFPEARNYVRGNLERDEYYYTNSIHLRADAPVDLITRIRKQAKFHAMIESGAIIHAFVGEELPSPESIINLVKKTLEQTQAAQLTISPEFTVCKGCNEMHVGLKETCPTCHSTDVYGLTRIVGYFSRITNWNKSKLGELRDRRSGRYAVPAVAAKPAPAHEPASEKVTV
ncbi:MAG: anaerobic ribonucleoside-triphosphate reductase [Candidatus Brocadiae bacterium]|nr:anaerobic ribonucleoside-triphosphate reductase [Candidatus Brocadiia bacterium]